MVGITLGAIIGVAALLVPYRVTRLLVQRSSFAGICPQLGLKEADPPSVSPCTTSLAVQTHEFDVHKLEG